MTQLRYHLLNVVFHGKSKTTYFWAFVYMNFLLSFNVKNSLLKFIQAR